ncbi:MAG: MotE family protein [Pelagimonas sp.]|uniref:MotE family protein n=1 Tax=Pelagimonas sp. TaxID=2073170 RepID=UPI003D6C54BE
MPLLKKTASKRAKKRPRRKAKGALSAIGALLLASAALRIGVGAGEALAREGGEEIEAPAMTEVAEVGQPVHSAQTDIADEDVMPLLKALNDREERIAKREEGIAVRMQALSVAEQEIERKLVALKTAEERLRDTMSLAQTAAEDDITRLTDVYANMKPKQAAALFEEMDPEFSAGFLARMRPDTAAGIMAGLSPSTAYTISVVLAGRNASVPKE